MRLLAVLFLAALFATAFAVRVAADVRAEKIERGEVAALARCRALHAAYLRHVEATGDRDHPGLAALADEVGGLVPVHSASASAERSYAAGAHYMYGLATRERRQADGTLVADYVLRAWPLAFGRSGDVEYVLQEGQLWIGANRIGRSGAEFGFPPPFPEDRIGKPRVPWRRVDLVVPDDGT